MKELEQVREIFLAPDQDEEIIAHNREVLAEWERSLAETSAFADWQSHEVAQQVLSQARTSYKDLGMVLAERRDLSEAERLSIFARQDACTFIIKLLGRDARHELELLHEEIRKELNAT
jgi:hypothetical protein